MEPLRGYTSASSLTTATNYPTTLPGQVEEASAATEVSFPLDVVARIPIFDLELERFQSVPGTKKQALKDICSDRPTVFGRDIVKCCVLKYSAHPNLKYSTLQSLRTPSLQLHP